MIYVFLSDGFEELEAVACIDLLRRAGLPVTTVAVGCTERMVTGSHQIRLEADRLETQGKIADLSAVVLPGGKTGVQGLEASGVVRDAVRYCLENGRPVAALCAAPSILGHMGVLKGKRATCFPGFEQELEGAQVCGDSVCVDGRILTGKGAGVSVDFALRLVEMLCGGEQAQKLGMTIQCRNM